MTAHSTIPTSTGRPLLTLADLLRLSPAELDAAYAGARTPLDLDGDYDGVLLTAQFPPRPRQFGVAGVNRALPWRGKTFTAAEARGANRFRLAGRDFTLWPFATQVVPSQFDGAPTLLVDYDLPGNPAFFRHGVFDELRQLRPGLYLGIGGIRLGGRNRFLFHWALFRPE